MEGDTKHQASLKVGDDWIKESGMFMYEDMMLVRHVDESALDKVKSFNFHATDILICTYPRSGTTWCQEMTWLVCNNADVEAARQSDIDIRSRFIEITNSRILPKKSDLDHLMNIPPPRVIKTHFTPQFFEGPREEVQYKTIIVMRNLKDVMVSHFHFYKNFYDFKGSWDDFFELFRCDKMIRGSWVKHSLKCWSLRDDPNILILKYEDMKANPSQTIRSIASFCEKRLTDEQVSVIAEFTFFTNMKKRGQYMSTVPGTSGFIRKGEVGGWREWFTNAQLEYVTELLRATTEKEGLFFNETLV